MKLIILTIFLTSAWAKPLEKSETAVIVENERENYESGGYRFFYRTSDEQTREEEGIIKNSGTDNEALYVTGSYSFIGTDGIFYKTVYSADENGFRLDKAISDFEPPQHIFLNTNSKLTSILSRIKSEKEKKEKTKDNISTFPTNY